MSIVESSVLNLTVQPHIEKKDAPERAFGVSFRTIINEKK